MKNYTIEHDPSKCDGCRKCVEACQKGNNLAEGISNCRILSLKVVKDGEVKEVYAYFSCMQCKKPKCAEACPTGALYREGPLDIVFLDKNSCVACLNCIFACPWGVPVFDPKNGVIAKCDLCYDRVKAGKKPFCVEACPNEALLVKEKKAPAKKAAKKPKAKAKASSKAQDQSSEAQTSA
ncbi:4Fe-4S dicluster domain-containing protein [Thermodesulfatator autotrophicus]|uniref:4Fe-4S ferredoxin n=1 Tax=Thermodesulfatator autotrophicus TaxID=1795632 RepID=A0A177E703_9BACT|nr:4Fe-4S dicluster domain-containing protein [Thermodesulfatator autotrophicus]OAG27727.1 4Fe-4S ferredoxin [Thermodesulfatator autotrophicus]